MIAIIALLFATWSSFNLLKDAPMRNDVEEEGGFQLPSKALWGMGIIAFCCMLGEGAMADWSTIYMQNIAKANPVLAPIGLGAFSGAMMIGRIFGDSGRAILGDGKLMIIVF